MKFLFKNNLNVKITVLILIVFLFGFLVLQNLSTLNYHKQNNKEEIVKTYGNIVMSENDRPQKTVVDCSKLELYKCPGNYPEMVGEPIIKDIDGDGRTEKILRYNLAMADRLVQFLYIYRNDTGSYKLVKTFEGDPYGFAKLDSNNIITVGRYLPITDGSKNWDDFSQFEITQYQWTVKGTVKISSEIINSTSTRDLSEEIQNNFYADCSNLTYSKVINLKASTSTSQDFYGSTCDGNIVKWQAKISTYYSQITGIKFCIVDKDHQIIDINKPCDWFWAISDQVINADDTSKNPNWDGLWVNYILRYFKVPFDASQRFYNNLYTVTGKISGLDCGVDTKCVPNINIISITK